MIIGHAVCALVAAAAAGGEPAVAVAVGSEPAVAVAACVGLALAHMALYRNGPEFDMSSAHRLHVCMNSLNSTVHVSALKVDCINIRFGMVK